MATGRKRKPGKRYPCGKRTKQQLENAADMTIRAMNEFFRGAPEWENYIRGADGNNKPRLWELNIGAPDYQTESDTVKGVVDHAQAHAEEPETA